MYIQALVRKSLVSKAIVDKHSASDVDDAEEEAELETDAYLLNGEEALNAIEMMEADDFETDVEGAEMIVRTVRALSASHQLIFLSDLSISSSVLLNLLNFRVPSAF